MSDEQRQQLFLGAASEIITPAPGVEMTGFIARVDPMRGAYDDLFVKATVFAEDAQLANAAALITFDLIDLEAREIAAIRSGIETATGIAAGRIGITCTHTHGGPSTMTAGRLGVVAPGYLERITQAAISAATSAAKAVAPVYLSAGFGSEPTVGKNRRIPGGVIDPEVAALRFQDAEAVVRALFVSYGCHPVTLGPNNTLATADYPGYVRRTLEAVYPGAAVQFATGCCGQVNNGHTSRDGDKGNGLHWRSFAEAERIGRAIAGEAAQAAEQAARYDAAAPLLDLPVENLPVRTARREVELPFLPLPPVEEIERLRAGWVAKAAEVAAREHRPGELERVEVFIAWADQALAGETIKDAPAEVQVIAIGDYALVLLPGESFVEFGLDIKARSPKLRAITLAYSNGRPGYIPHRSAYPAGGYEVDEAFRYYGYPSCFAPEAGELLVETAVELLTELSAGGTA